MPRVNQMSKRKSLKIETAEVVYTQPIQDKSHKIIEGRTPHQGEFIRSMHHNALTIATGPAGTGKTACAVGTAVKLYKAEKIDHIVISRPAVPVFEQIGFSPGDTNEKMTPYIMPMKKEFDKFLPKGEFEHLLKAKVIEIVPLCYLQGWNIDGMLIVDECGLLQFAQFKLILTRLCKEGRIVLMGDPAQDGGSGTGRDFESVIRKLEKLNSVGVIRFDASDNQRHQLVNDIQVALNGEPLRDPIRWEDRFRGSANEPLGEDWKLYR